MGSKSFHLNGYDVQEIAKIVLLSGVSAAITAGLQVLQATSFGVWDPIITASLTVLLKALQQWTSDTSNTGK